MDFNKYRLSNNNSVLQTNSVLIQVPVRKPNRQEFIRVHSAPEWTLDANVILDDSDQKAVYIVAPEMSSALSTYIKPKRLHTVVNTQGYIFIWPLNLPGEESKANSWTVSALRCATAAQSGWVQIHSNMQNSSYDLKVPFNQLDEPVWPEKYTFDKILELAFAGRIINDESHPFVKRLIGVNL